jgi:hypothetical protein
MVNAQTARLKAPDGESILYADIQTLASGVRIETVFTTKSAHAFVWNAGSWQAQPSSGLLSVATYPGLTLTQITSVTPKLGTPGVFFVLLDDGVIFMQTDSSTPALIPYGKVYGQQYEQFLEITTDGRFVLSDYHLYQTGDNGAHWYADTDPNQPVDIVVDAAGTAFKANGVIEKRQKDSSTWQSVKGPASTSLYLSHLGILFSFCANTNYTFLSFSTDGGSTWHLDTAGGNMEEINAISDDASGTLYLLTYRSNNGKLTLDQLYRQAPPYNIPWEKVTTPFAQWLNSGGGGSIGGIFGDSILCAATECGLFVSSDRGDSWTNDNTGIDAEDIHTLLQLQSGALVASTNSGIFKAPQAGANWSKIFPDSVAYPGVTYRSAVSVFVDAKNVLYAECESSDTGENQQPMIYMSQNEGASWSLDTSTLMYGNSSLFYVDRDGYEYYAIQESFSTINVYQRTAKQPWTLQTVQATNDDFSDPYYLGSDKQGSLYIGSFLSDGSTGTLYEMSNHDGNWGPNAFGLSGAVVSGIAEDHRKNVYLGDFHSSIFRQPSGSFGWSAVAAPPVLTQGAVTSISIDSTDGLFAAFTVNAFPATNVGNGVYREDTTGLWTFIGGDSSAFISLVTFGDTTYGLTGNQNGIYLFTSQRQNSVEDHSLQQVGLRMLIDRTQEHVRLQTTFAQPTHLTVKFVDVLGRELSSQDIFATAGKAEYETPLVRTSGVGFIIVHSLETGEQWMQKYVW